MPHLMMALPSRRRGAFASILAAGTITLLAVVIPSCGHGSTGSAACVPGQQNKCYGAGQCLGYQVCKTDGTYGDCVCGGADGGSRPFARTGPFSGLLGAACMSSSDCRNGLECVGPDSKIIHGEGPSAGMCLTRCSVQHQELCTSVDATAKCFVLDDNGTPDTSDDVSYCLPGCKLGDQPASADKCRGRVDVVCSNDSGATSVGYCRPSCRSNLDCAPRFCDLGTGLCADSAPAGDPIGSSCDPGSSKCSGGCMQQGSGFYECTGVCGYETQGCGQNDEFPLDYFCSIPESSMSGAGDLGYCAKLCDCDSDCNRTDAICQANHDLIAMAGRQGVCVSKTAANGTARTGLPCK